MATVCAEDWEVEGKREVVGISCSVLDDLLYTKPRSKLTCFNFLHVLRPSEIVRLGSLQILTKLLVFFFCIARDERFSDKALHRSQFECIYFSYYRLRAGRSGVRIPARASELYLLQNVQTCGGAPTNLLFSGYRDSFPLVKRSGCGIDHSPPSSDEVKNKWSYTSVPPYIPSLSELGNLCFTLPL
jgi:hypothetical protein